MSNVEIVGYLIAAGAAFAVIYWLYNDIKGGVSQLPAAAQQAVTNTWNAVTSGINSLGTAAQQAGVAAYYNTVGSAETWIADTVQYGVVQPAQSLFGVVTGAISTGVGAFVDIFDADPIWAGNAASMLHMNVKLGDGNSYIQGNADGSYSIYTYARGPPHWITNTEALGLLI